MVRPLSATALWMACLIHQVAYVEKRKPFSGSNLSAARMRPTLPSWMRSPKGSPIPRYFFATGMTSLRFFSMSLDRAVLSPSLVLLPRSISSSCVSSLPQPICPKYLERGFGISRSLILLIVSRAISNPPCYALYCCRAVGSSGASFPHVTCVRLLSGPRFLALVYKTTQGAGFLPPIPRVIYKSALTPPTYLFLRVIGATVGREAG